MRRHPTTTLIARILLDNPKLRPGVVQELEKEYARALIREALEREGDTPVQQAPPNPEDILTAPIPPELVTPEMRKRKYTHGIHLWVYPPYNQGVTQPAYLQWLDERGFEQLYGDLRAAARDQEDRAGDIAEDISDVATAVWDKTEQSPPQDLFKDRYDRGEA